MTDTTDNTDELLNFYQLADLFTQKSPASAKGERTISVRLVRSWWERRAVTGFPNPVGTRREGRYVSWVWDINVALEWFLSYEPKRGGAPKGNRNARRHGRFAGVRAQYEEAKRARVKAPAA